MIRTMPTAAIPRSRMARPVSARITGHTAPTSTMPATSQSTAATPPIAIAQMITAFAMTIATR